jgi:hypothetical protein
MYIRTRIIPQKSKLKKKNQSNVFYLFIFFVGSGANYYTKL